MLPFAIYLLKVTICSGILFGYYWLLLRNKIFHQYNRFYLLAIVLLSLSLPVIEINIWHAANTPAPQAIQLLQVVNSSNEYLDEIIVTSKPADISTEQILALLYLSITLVFFGVFIQTISRIRTLFKKHRHSLVENVYFVNTTAKGTPFSFLRYIFWNDHIDPESTTGHQIFKHELAHVQQKHSYDKLFINATLIICWCNPFFWLIRKELNMIHEFMADKIAVEDSDTETFAAMILQATYPQHRFHLTNPFFYSPIKRRLLMLTKNKNPKVSYVGRILVLPLAVLVFAAFTLKAKPFKNNNTSVYNGKKITVVIDAGHGGTDYGAHSLDGNTTEKELTLAIIKKIKTLNSNANINLVLTRETDIFQTVQEKAAFTNAQNADLFVSIHIDATSEEAADSKTGLSVYVAKDNFINAGSSKLFASALIKEFKNSFPLFVSDLPQQRVTGIKVLQEITCPAVIVETGYITNKNDLAYLKTDAGKNKIASNILAAIERYAFAKEEKAQTVNSSSASDIQNLQLRKTDTVPQINFKNYNNALIVADGEIISNAELKKIKPEDIKSIHVLKPKSAIAGYGAKGKNGAVIIQTKMKELVLRDVPLTYIGDTSTANGTLTGNIKFRNYSKDPAKQPLYVIDGNIQTGKIDLDAIDANEIKSINVIKGNNALKKYGEPATNGVVEITTKNNPAIMELRITEVPVTNSLNEVVMVGYGSFDTKNDKNTQDEPIFTKTEKEPSFPGGQPAWVRYLQKNLNANLPIEEGWKPGVYKIVISFIVRKDGTLADIKTNDYPGSKTSENCIELIRKGPKWEPAIQNGHPVNAYKKQPITFVVEKN
jgi:TonB-dependent SusC/RagA subfamily outer membrane receptor